MRRLWCRAFGHGSGKKTWIASSDAGLDAVSQQLDRVAAGHGDVADAVDFGPSEHRTETGRVHVDAEVVAPRVGRRHRDHRLTHAAADLQDQRAIPSEERRAVQPDRRRLVDIEPALGPEPGERIRRGRAHPTPSRMERPDHTGCGASAAAHTPELYRSAPYRG